jgi:hypothetical protein
MIGYFQEIFFTIDINILDIVILIDWVGYNPGIDICRLLICYLKLVFLILLVQIQRGLDWHSIGVLRDYSRTTPGVLTEHS